MVHRLGWVAGLAGIGLALARAGHLVRSSATGLPWQATLLLAVAFGIGLTWAGVAAGLRGRVIGAIHVVAVALTVVRIAVPETTWLVFPTADSLPALGEQLGFARDVIRSGIAPVIPLPGIVAILAVVFWGMGGALAWGLMNGRPYLAVVTPLVVYLEFAVMDRRPGGWWSTAFMAAIGIALVAVALDRRWDGTGRLTATSPRRTLARSVPGVSIVTLVVTLAGAVTASEAMAGLVPRSGYLEWRTGRSLSGEYYGSVSYNPFVGIRQRLLSQTDVPVFVAGVTGDADPGAIYWRLVTLDGFNGEQWHIGAGAEIERPAELESFEPPATAFAGLTESVRSEVTILALQQDWLPAPYAPTTLTAENAAVEGGYRVKSDDGSLRFDALTYRGMTYTVVSRIPTIDLEVLGRGSDGSPSVVFQGAVDAGDLELADDPAVPVVRTLPDRRRYLELPTDLDPGLLTLAAVTTNNLQTDFERALALERFFLTPGAFTYSTEVLPGHGATGLSAWLLDPDSDGYRTGYCEQFATSMAVMARLLGIPSRVVLGFSPGEEIEPGRVLVRDRNAHAWVELWMPTQGWVPFDPTPRGDTTGTAGSLPFDIDAYLEVPEPDRPVIDPGERDPVIFDRDDEFEIRNEPTELPGGAGLPAPQLPGWAVAAVAALLSGFLLIPGVKWVRRRRRLRKARRGDISAAWAEIVDRLVDFGDGPTPATTPAEVAAAVGSALHPLADVYAESRYAPATPSVQRLEAGVASLGATEREFTGRYSWRARIAARYRVRSLLPGRWARRR